MSVIILEGINGTGKSTLARALADKLCIPILRPFRHFNTNHHMNGGSTLELELKKHGVPVNTHVDDLYLADFLAVTKVGAVLDRSMPSAIAYAYMRDEMKLDSKAQALLDLWQTILVSGPRVFYVQLTAQPLVIKDRCAERWSPNKKQMAALDKAFTLSFRAIKFPKLAMDTSAMKLADGVERICRALKS